MQELEDLVIRAYALYNQILMDVDRKVILRAWYDLLEDLPFDGCKKALLDHAAVSQYRPTPGDIRRGYINTHNKIGEPPPALAAWATLIGQIKLANSGLPIEMGLHPCLAKVVELLGDTVYQLHNTTDQINFIKTYEQVVLEFQQQKFKIL
jgi:hypothetical protein